MRRAEPRQPEQLRVSGGSRWPSEGGVSCSVPGDLAQNAGQRRRCANRGAGSMAAGFVSHSSPGPVVTQRVVAGLRTAGFAALFVDFDPEQGIPAGRSWERELYAQLRRTDAVIFLASEASVASRWCFAELSLARSLGRPVFPLRLRPGVALPLLADVQWTDLTDPEMRLERLLAGLRPAGLDPADSFAWDPHRSPYPGLAPFPPDDAAVFFGRQPQTHRLMELLTPTLQRGAGRFIAIVRPSGSGKSSLLHARL